MGSRRAAIGRSETAVLFDIITNQVITAARNYNLFMGDEKQKDKKAHQLNIELSEDIAEGVYSNLVMIAHSPEEFILDFIRVVPGVAKARVKSRIIVTPQHAKRLLRALSENIERYEHAYGNIDERVPPGQTIHFGGGSIGEA